MRFTFSHHGILCKLAIWLIALWLVVGCSSSLSPTPTKAPATSTTTHEPPATPTLTTVPATSTTTHEPSATPSSPAKAATLTTEVTRGIVYTNVDTLRTKLDVYAPSEPGPWPVVVVAHGSDQSLHNFRNLAEAIASQGAVVYNVDYRVTLPLPIGIEDIACAVRFARTTAADYGGDPDWITLVGSSTGAANGAVIAMAGDDFEGDCVVTDASALLDAFVGFEGFYNFAKPAIPIPDLTILKDEDPELFETVNPYSHIGRNPDLQVRLVHGDDSDTVWYDIQPIASIEFHQALADAGYDVDLILVEGAHHTALTNRYSDAFAMTVELVMELARASSQ